MSIAALIITFMPNYEALKMSIINISKQVDIVIVVDNSTISLSWLYEFSSPKVRIYSCDGNTGIANALNIGYEVAIQLKCDWVLSLDQDSIVPDTIISTYVKFLEKNDINRIGALVPAFKVCPQTTVICGIHRGEVQDYMTSGSLVNLSAFQEVGGFEEKLFIDMVDTDFGLKLINAGYIIFRVPEVILTHNIGNAKEWRLLGKHIGFITHHNYQRRYYITRNLLYIRDKYGDKFSQFNYPYKKILKSVLRLLLFEEDKIKKLKSIYRGIRDYKMDIYGKYRY